MPNRAATPEMIFVPGGAFTMGDVWGDGLSDELPVFACEVSDFYFGRYPITNEEFVIFLNDIGKNVDDDGNMILDLRSGDPASTIAFADGAYRHGRTAGRHPVRYLSWHGATNYCRWLSSRLGCGVRLPTELEWQYAACGGKNLKWGLGNRFDKDEYVISQHEGPSPVDFGEESEYGLKCITGNIFEWCEDEYRFSFNPHDNPVLQHHRVMKGGAFSLNDITNFRNSKRFSCFEKSCLNCIGLRILSQQQLPPHFALSQSAK